MFEELFKNIESGRYKKSRGYRMEYPTLAVYRYGINIDKGGIF
jgi:hypothetical protein